MSEPPQLEHTVAKLAMLALAKGIPVDGLVEMINSGASMIEILRALEVKSAERLN